MSRKLDAAQFLAGREAYLDKTPLLQIVEHVHTLTQDQGECYMVGYCDGMLQDLRDCAKNAREELANRKSVPMTPKELYGDQMWPPHQGC